MRPSTDVGVRRGSIVDPAIEKYMLSLQRAMNVDAFWKAAQQLLAAAVPNRLIGFMLQHNPIMPPFACPMVFSQQSRLRVISPRSGVKGSSASAISFPIEATS